jgi:probable rRNA maturation factor
MIVSRQNKLRVNVAPLRAFARRLGRELKLGGRHFSVCLVDDGAMRELNAAFRNKPYATDVLSFVWKEAENGRSPRRAKGYRNEGKSSPFETREFGAFLGDVVISVESAQRNARGEGHSAAAEIRWLILHGLLHLLGMDHETDHGEMESLELELRARLGLNGTAGRGHGGAGRTKPPAGRAFVPSQRAPRASNEGTRKSGRI